MSAWMRGIAALAMVLAVAGGVRGDDETSSVSDELRQMQERTASLESVLAPAGGDEVDMMRTVKGNASVQIGGDVNVDIIFKERDDITSDQDEITSTEFHTNSANLRFKVHASPDSYLYIKLDLDDAWYDHNGDGREPDQDDLLEECKFVWNNVYCSNMGLVFGKGEVPYGQDRTLGIIQSYHHNSYINGYSSEGPVVLLAGTEAIDPLSTNTNPHANVGNLMHPGEVDNVFMGSINYTWSDCFKFEFAVFQNNDSTGNGRLTRGMHEDRPDDHLGFQSVAARFWAMPMEGLTLEFSLMNKHLDSMDELKTIDPYTGKTLQHKDNEMCVSLGWTYVAKTVPWEFFGEYQHGWDWNYTDDYDVDIFQIGCIWSITECIDLGLMGEWMGIDTRGNDEDYWKVVANGKYTMENGMFLILEYGHEMYRSERRPNFNGSDDRDADVLAFRAGWAF